MQLARRQESFWHRIYPGEDGDYVVLELHGEIERDAALRCHIEMHSFARSLGIASFLVDVTDAVNLLPFPDNIGLAEQNASASTNLMRQAAVAVLAKQGDRTHDAVVAMLQRVGHRVQLFTQRSAAIAHLRGDGDGDGDE